MTTLIERHASQELGYVEYVQSLVEQTPQLFGYVEYTGDAVTSPTADTPTVAQEFAYVEYIESLVEQVGSNFAYVEFTEGNLFEACQLLGYVEYVGDAVASPTADIHTVCQVLGYVEYEPGEPPVLIGRVLGPAAQQV